jgi:hypothetical protein
MVSAIGSSPTFNITPTSVALTAGIETQIARDQKALSNCVNCASAETKQGQADIQALSNRISLAKARLEQITATNPAGQVAALNPATVSEITARETAENEATTNSRAVASIAKASDDSAVGLNAFDSTAGRLVDEYV